MIRQECGRLLARMHEQWCRADRTEVSGGELLPEMIRNYKRTLKQLERAYGGQDENTYLVIRRARFAVDRRMADCIASEILYGWMVQNLCELEALSFR